MKNIVKLDNYYSPEELINALEKFVHRYNNERYHESLKNLTPADVYYGRGDLIIKKERDSKKDPYTKEDQNIDFLKIKKNHSIKKKN